MTSTRPPVYNGRYELRNQVARGGTAQVYLARDIILDRPVALKVLFPELSTDSTFVERFRREAQAAANLSHQNIVPVFDWGESDRTYFIVMEYVDGEPLSTIIHSQAPIAPGDAAQVAADIAKALSYADRHGVVHRDVKPGNVLITSDGQVKVTDFGIARAIGGGDEQVTQTGLVMGTATYFSPEQAQGLGVDGRSDIYSLGVVLYEMLTGRPPFSGETPVSIAYQHVQETPPRPRSINADIPPALEAIVMQAMAKLPAERYQSADDMRIDLERFLRHQTVLATPPSEFAPATMLLNRTSDAYGMDTTTVPAAEAYRAPVSRRTTPYWIAAAVVLVIAIAAVALAGLRNLGYLGGARYVKVPYVIGDSVTKAESKLRAVGLDYRRTTAATRNPSQTGKVLGEDPNAQTSLKTGTTVRLSVGGTVPMVTVPSVVGLDVTKAKAQIKSQGLQAKTTTIPFTAGATIGNVTAQHPDATQQVPKGSSVQITVVGKPISKPVPTWSTDETQSQAALALGAAGFQLGTTSNAYSTTVPANDVISSNPAPGTLEPEGTPINLTISLGPGIKVPDLYNDSYATAQSALSAVGLNISIGPPTTASNPSQIGTVLDQSPRPGAKRAAGQTVTVSLGQADQSTTTTQSTLPIGNTGPVPSTTPGASGPP